MSVWSRAPVPLRSYVVLVVAAALGIAVLKHNPLSLVAVGVSLAIAYSLLSGVRWVWLALIALTVLDAMIYLLASAGWYQIAILVLPSVLLLLPQTRRHFARDAIAAEA